MTMPQDEERENRIDMEIVVDAYTDEEQFMGWYYYLERKLNFPFPALLAKATGKSPEQIEVVGMSSEEECEDRQDMLVDVAYEDDTFPTRLAEISAPEADEETQEAIADWHYWLARGYEL